MGRKDFVLQSDVYVHARYLSTISAPSHARPKQVGIPECQIIDFCSTMGHFRRRTEASVKLIAHPFDLCDTEFTQSSSQKADVATKEYQVKKGLQGAFLAS